MSSPAVEDYLKAIFKLSHQTEPATTSAIATRLGVAAPSVTGMLKRLSEQGLVEHVPYYGARLTGDGEETALRMIRRHRILELFLVNVLGYTWDCVHDEAERLEHAASDDLIERMAEVLGMPESDPHGAPIPAADGRYDAAPLPTLAHLAVGRPAVLRRVSDEDPAALRYLAMLKLVPGARVEVLERAPFNGPLRLRVGAEEQMVGVELAASLEVEDLRKDLTLEEAGHE